MPNGIAVTRMMPRNSKPENTWPKAGNGTEKPKFAKASPTPFRLNPPSPRPNRFDPHAMIMPTAMATRPAGMPFQYFTPPNQLTRMMAKHTSPICGVMYISSAGRIEMKVTETPASVPSSAARGVIFRIYGAMKPPIMRIKLWKNTQTRPADQPLIGSPVLSVIGSMITKVTMNMCGTLTPDGSAQTSLRPVFCASL